MRKSVAVKRIITVPCKECGAPLSVGANKVKAPTCTECGVKAAEKAAREMASKSGETYAKWQAAMLRAIERS